MTVEQPSLAAASSTSDAEHPTPEAPAQHRGLSGHRLVWLVAGVAVISLAAGIGLSAVVKSPAQQAAEVAPPEAGVITAAIENRVLANDLTIRADVAFEDAVEVKIPAASGEGAAIVTGQVPEPGQEITAASVVLEVTGRPVIVLQGELPAYRTLTAGSTGPDVAQLKESLRALGIDPGRGKADVYDAATAAAVQQLYTRVGYPAPSNGPEANSSLEVAQQAVRSAETELARAKAELAAGPEGQATNVERLEADNAVRAAERALADARASGGDVPAAEDDLALARARRAALDVPRDNSSLVQAVTTAQESWRSARDELVEAQQNALTPLPLSEVLYLPSVPRRVDAVNVARGDQVPSGPALSVSGASLALRGSVSSADGKLLKTGMTGSVTLPDDSTVEVTVTDVSSDQEKPAPEGEENDSADSKGPRRFTVAMQFSALTPEQGELVRQQNLRVRIPINSTGKKVLAVPTAALTAGPGGESRIEVKRDDTITLIEVKTGLSAGGFVEIMDTEQKLEAGDRVVVGR